MMMMMSHSQIWVGRLQLRGAERGRGGRAQADPGQRHHPHHGVRHLPRQAAPGPAGGVRGLLHPRLPRRLPADGLPRPQTPEEAAAAGRAVRPDPGPGILQPCES